MINYKEYPENWKEIRERILLRANDCCEGSPAYPDCRARNHERHPVTGSVVILTIAHLDHDHANETVKDDRLRAWCQRCHLRYDHHRHVMKRKYGINFFKTVPELQFV